jgi:hypothetical protein
VATTKQQQYGRFRSGERNRKGSHPGETQHKRRGEQTAIRRRPIAKIPETASAAAADGWSNP